jgi:hypothetical protein
MSLRSNKHEAVTCGECRTVGPNVTEPYQVAMKMEGLFCTVWTVVSANILMPSEASYHLLIISLCSLCDTKAQ